MYLLESDNALRARKDWGSSGKAHLYTGLRIAFLLPSPSGASVISAHAGAYLQASCVIISVKRAALLAGGSLTFPALVLGLHSSVAFTWG